MRALAFCFAASMVLWCALAWCVVCVGTLAGSTTIASSALDLTASLVCIGLAGGVVALWLATFDGETTMDETRFDEMMVD